MGGGGGGAKPQSDNTKFYKLLEVEKDASEAEVCVCVRVCARERGSEREGCL